MSPSDYERTEQGDEPFPGSPDDMMNTIAALRARVAKLERALEEIAERRFLAETMIEIARAALKDAPQ